MKAIYFDMDGTIADLYNVPGWLEMLMNEDTKPYEVAAPMYDMNALNNLLVKSGLTIGVISWGSKGGSNEYTKRVKKAKFEWIKKYLPCVSEFHVVKYGTPKHKVRKIQDSILVDDNESVRAAWSGVTIDANNNILKSLEKVLAV